MNSTWYSPEEFCIQFAGNKKLIEAVVDVESTPLRFQDYVVRVARRQQYAEECRQANKESCIAELDYPLVDKKSDLVFEVEEGAHGYLRIVLCEAYEERGDRSFDQLQDDFIYHGHGYFHSSVSTKGVTIGKVLFDKELLDEDDTAILLYRRIDIIEERKGHP